MYLYMYLYNWVTLLYSRNGHITNQLYLSKNKKGTKLKATASIILYFTCKLKIHMLIKCKKMKKKKKRIFKIGQFSSSVYLGLQIQE